MGISDLPYGAPRPTKIAYINGRPSSLQLQRIQLLVNPNQNNQREHIFEQDIITIGTREDNDLVLAADDTISRQHCHIIQEDDRYLLIDRNSTNGTHINGVRVREAYISPGATIAVGNTHIRFNPFQERISISPAETERFGDIVGKSIKMREIFSVIEKISPTSATVIIEGETGTGKEVIAQTIHKVSSRSQGPFVVFDCGAVPESLIESELFGHEKGSFTGAVMSRKGLFEMADGGTIFLDELGELALDLQPKLLRVLEQREVRRIGANKSSPINVRVIAATNRALEQEVRAGNFREDLFYRLSVVRLYLPALRERREDIPLLVNHFLHSKRFNRMHDSEEMRVRSIEREAVEALQRYDWPGNVRELVNVIERACSMTDTDCIRLLDLPDHISGANTRFGDNIPLQELGAHRTEPVSDEEFGSEASWDALPDRKAFNHKPFKEAKEEWISIFEQDYLTELLVRHKGNISQASREADIDRKYFRKLMQKYNIEADDLND